MITVLVISSIPDLKPILSAHNGVLRRWLEGQACMTIENTPESLVARAGPGCRQSTPLLVCLGLAVAMPGKLVQCRFTAATWEVQGLA